MEDHNSHLLDEDRSTETAQSTGSDTVGEPHCVHSTETVPDSEPDAEVECWICRDSTSMSENPIVSGRCLCVGSIGFVHQDCIDAWVLENDHPRCASCGAQYHLVATDLPDGVSYPTSWRGRVAVVGTLIVTPVLRIVVDGLVRLFFFWLCESLLLGCVLYWQRPVRAAVRAVSTTSSPSFPTENTTVNTATTPAVGAWDILNMVAYGFVFLNMLRVFRRGYWGWLESFGWPKPAEAADGVDAADRELSSDPDDEGDDDQAGADEEWITSSDDDQVAGEQQADAAPEAEDHGVAPPEPAAVDPHGVQHSRTNTVWRTFHCVRKLRKTVDMHRSFRVLWQNAMNELLIGVPISFLLGSVPTAVLLGVGVVALFFYWRWRNPRKRLRELARRYDEVGERKADATEEDVYLWYRTYCAEMLFFSFLLPVTVGAAAHYAVSPYFVSFAPSFGAFLNTLNPLQVLLYWVLGSIGAVALMQMEAQVMVPLFAPGVDLYFIRSIDLQFTIDADYWRFILTQVFDADPLVILYDFARMALIESLVLFLFLRLPAAFISQSADALATVWHFDQRPAVPMIGFPVRVEDQWSGFIVLEHFVRLALACVGLGGVDRSARVHYLQIICRYFLSAWALGGIVVTAAFVRMQKLQLRILRPFALFVGRHVVRMENFLFDAERLALVDTFLRVKDIDRLAMPMIPETEVFKRRHMALPREEVPSKLTIRLVVFSVLFFAFSATAFWLVPAALMSVFAIVIHNAFGLLLMGIVATGFVVDPSTMATTVLPVWLCLPLLPVYLVVMVVWSMISMLAVSLDTRARDAIDFHYNVRQTVAASLMTDATAPETTPEH